MARWRLLVSFYKAVSMRYWEVILAQTYEEALHAVGTGHLEDSHREEGLHQEEDRKTFAG